MIITRSASETRQIGYQYAESVSSASIVIFQGPVGAGKSVFIRGILSALGVSGHIPSPSFTLINRYQGKKNNLPVNIFHIDLYRLETPEEIADLGFQEIIYSGGISLVEWGERAAGLYNGKTHLVAINFGTEENERQIEIIKN